MGQRLLGRRLRRQAQKGKLRPRTMQRAMNTMRIDPRPPPAIPVKPVTIKQGGSVESYQDQVMRKFIGGQIKKMVAGRRVASRPFAPPTTVTKQPKKKRGYGKATEGKPTLSKGGKIKSKKK